jgi:hypothetical protein
VQEAVEADKAILTTLEATAQKIRDHRNTQFIHLSERLLQPPFGVIPESDAFAYADIGSILTDSGRLLNRYSVFLSGSELLMQVWGEDAELPYLLKLLARGRKALDDEQESDI